jgi:uncharacterized protein YoxC
MTADLSIAVISITFVVLVTFLVITLIQTRKTLESIRKDLHNVSNEAVQLMHKLDALTADIKSKSESLNFVFRPLKSINKAQKQDLDTEEQVVGWIALSLCLFEKIKTAVKHYAK